MESAGYPQVPVKQSADVLPVPLLESANNPPVPAQPVGDTVAPPHAPAQGSAAIPFVQKLCDVLPSPRQLTFLQPLALHTAQHCLQGSSNAPPVPVFEFLESTGGPSILSMPVVESAGVSPVLSAHSAS